MRRTGVWKSLKKVTSHRVVVSRLSAKTNCVLTGGCELDKAYDGPKLPTRDDGSYEISLGFIKEMLEWFKAGKTLPKRCVCVVYTVTQADGCRYVWEIALHAYSYFVQEESMVTLNLEDDMTCDVISDVHGAQYRTLYEPVAYTILPQVNSTICCIYSR